MFYNTGIATYIWILDNAKAPERKGKVQLVNATQMFEKMRKNLGNKRKEISSQNLKDIVHAYAAFEETETCKIFKNTDFGYRQITVERPLKLAFKIDDQSIEDALLTKAVLKLSEDERGLHIEIEPPDTQVARDLLVSLERGDISQMSFGFQVISDKWEHNSEGNALDIRTLEKVRLWDVSPVTFPFYKETDVAVRSHEEWQKTLKEPEPTWNRIPIMRRKLKLQEWR
jgi:HK97 family phage prohead protease